MKIRQYIETHKFLVLTILLSLFVFAAGFCFLYKAVVQGALLWWLLILLVIGMASIPVFAFLVRKKKQSIQMLTVLILAVLGFIYLFVFSPNSIPDEPLHYTTAYHLSNQMLFKFGDESHDMLMRVEDDAYVKSASKVINKDQYISVAKNNYLVCKNKQLVKVDQAYMKNKAVVYIAPAMGITLGRIFNLSAYWTYQLGRLFNFLSFLIFVYFAIKLMPFGKVAIAAIAMLPINIHIMASYSYDVFSVGGVLLLFAYIMHLLYSVKEIGIKQLLILAAMIIIIVPQKVVYIGVVGLVFLLPKEKFKSPKLHFLFKCAFCLMAALSILIVQMQNASKLVSDNVTNTQTGDGFSIQYVLTHLGEIARMLFYTIYYETDFYLKSLIAHFGWFQIAAPWFLAIPVIVVLLISFMKKEGEQEDMSLTAKLYNAFLFIVIFLITELLLLIDHTHKGCVYIGGVQGRYFIPALPLVFLALRNNVITLSKKADDLVLILMPALNVLILLYCIFSVLAL